MRVNSIIEADFHTDVRITPGKVTDVTLPQVSSGPCSEFESIFRQRFTQARAMSTANSEQSHGAVIINENTEIPRHSTPHEVDYDESYPVNTFCSIYLYAN